MEYVQVKFGLGLEFKILEAFIFFSSNFQFVV